MNKDKQENTLYQNGTASAEAEDCQCSNTANSNGGIVNNAGDVLINQNANDMQNAVEQNESDKINDSQAVNCESVNDNLSKEKTAEDKNFVRVKMPSIWTRFVKRTFDICSSGAVVAILLPFFILFTPLVALAMRGNPFFVQKRVGKNEKIFSIIKYRTMTNAKDKDGNLLPDAERLTKFGKIMRATSIDELPELFNIFIGQMSVVGPRPLLVEYLPFYTDCEKQRHLVRPGLTGLAQINGRNAISWEQKFKKDIEYVNELGFIKDLRIIITTLIKIFKREGISQEGEATAVKFSRK